MLQLFSLMVCDLWLAPKRWRYPETTTKRRIITQLFWLLLVGCNCFSCPSGWPCKRAKPTKRPFMAAKLYTAYIALSRVFAEIFQKNFLHTLPTIPKLGVLLHCIAWDKSKAILNCRLFAFALKMILNLILKTNLKTVSNSKTVLNLILNLILNLKMFHVKHKINHKKPIYGQKIIMPRFSFVKNFFKKTFSKKCLHSMQRPVIL